MIFMPNQFLYDYQLEAVKNMRNGCILNGGVGSGKSRTGLYYYFSEQGGSYIPEFIPAKNPRDLYIITTAMKRDSKEWIGELANFSMSPNPECNYYNNKIVIDSWNNIKKYADVHGAFFIFDEDRITGKGAWVKTFLDIARKNRWIVLSATPGDNWEQYIPIFVANGFYKNRSEFCREHIVYSRYCTKFPKIEKFIGTGTLIRHRNEILVDMDFNRPTEHHNIDVHCEYDIPKYKNLMKTRWDPYKDEPITQASSLCYALRRIVNEDESRQTALLDIVADNERTIVFYSYDYELDILRNLGYMNDGDAVEVAEWNGHKHQPIPNKKKWVYLVQYASGCEGWNCIATNTMVFYSQQYSYKVLNQACGRIDRLNTKYVDLYYYHLKSTAPIDLAISKAISEKKTFNENKYFDDTLPF